MKFLTIFPYLAIYSEPLGMTYASFGGGGSHMVKRGIPRGTTPRRKTEGGAGFWEAWTKRLEYKELALYAGQER